MIVMSPDGKSICFQWSVSILLLMRMSEWVLAKSVLCVVGYIGIQSFVAMVMPKLLTVGSCIATTSMLLLASTALEMRLC
jgi:hypothetical protein